MRFRVTEMSRGAPSPMDAVCQLESLALAGTSAADLRLGECSTLRWQQQTMHKHHMYMFGSTGFDHARALLIPQARCRWLAGRSRKTKPPC